MSMAHGGICLCAVFAGTGASLGVPEHGLSRDAHGPFGDAVDAPSTSYSWRAGWLLPVYRTYQSCQLFSVSRAEGKREDSRLRVKGGDAGQAK